MLQKAFFKVDVVDRIYDTPVFEKTTPGAYEFAVPEEYNYVVIEYAGAGGGTSYTTSGTVALSGGGGSIKKTQKTKARNISGIIGATATSRIGGSGYNAGKNGQTGGPGGGFYGYGGGGSTSVVVGEIINEASGGGGANARGVPSGAGGGKYGGAGVSSSSGGEGGDATDPNQTGLNKNKDGYVKIWAGYDPYFRG